MENASLGFHIGTTNLYLSLENFIEHNTPKLGEANNLSLGNILYDIFYFFFLKKTCQP